MIALFGPALLVSALYPLLLAAHACRRTPLLHTVVWALAAWGAWLAVALAGGNWLLYVALCLTGCAAVGVLGARRPQAGAWNGVLLALLAVMLLPIVEEAVLGNEAFGFMRLALVAGAIAIGVLNYLPTRLWLAALLVALGAAAGLYLFAAHNLAEQKQRPALQLVASCFGVAPWLAYLGSRSRRLSAQAVDRDWQSFRNRFGLFWSLRVREQFNRAAANHGWATALTWHGLEPPDRLEEAQKLLHELLRRFRHE